MSKLETVPLKSPLDLRTNLNFDINHFSIITCLNYEQSMSYHCTSKNNTNFFLFQNRPLQNLPGKKNLTITISSHQASCKYRKKKEKQGTRTPNKVQNAMTKVLKNTEQRPCTKYSRSFTQPFVRETGNISSVLSLV